MANRRAPNVAPALPASVMVRSAAARHRPARAPPGRRRRPAGRRRPRVRPRATAWPGGARTAHRVRSATAAIRARGPARRGAPRRARRRVGASPAASAGRGRPRRDPSDAVEAGGIEPPTRRCKRRVFPLAPRPRTVGRLGHARTWDHAWRPWPLHLPPSSARRSRTTTSCATGSPPRRTASGCPTTCARSCSPPTARSRSRSPSGRPTEGSTSTPATASSTTARAGRTRAGSATTPTSTSTRSAPWPPS